MEKIYFDLDTFNKGGASVPFTEKGLMEFYSDTHEQLVILMEINDAINNLPSDATIEDFLDIVLMGDKLLLIDFTALYEFQKSWTSNLSRCNRRVRTYVNGLKELQSLFLEHTQVFIPFGPVEFDRVKVLLKELIGQISYFLYYQFEFDRTLGSDEIPYVISTYCHRIGRDIQEFIDEQFALYQKNILENNPHMSAFDKFPGLVEDFISIAPDYSYDIDLMDLDTIQKIIDGSLSIEKLDEYMEEKFGEQVEFKEF